MPAWTDRYVRGDCVAVWSEMTSADATSGMSDAEASDAEGVVCETMRRCRSNVERLVELLPATGYRFQPGEGLATFRSPSATAEADLALLQARVGTLPTTLRHWYLEVGEVNLMGTSPLGWCTYPDPLVVQAPFDYVLGERDTWEQDRGTQWDRGPFVIDFSPDYLHKANVSGGAPYSVPITGGGLDTPVLWERNQTTFVNYLRISFRWAGMPGFAFSTVPPPPELREIAAELQPI